jgi:hypothetical protein
MPVDKQQCFFPSKLEGDLLVAVRVVLAKAFRVTSKAGKLTFYKEYKQANANSPTFHLRAFPLADIPATTGMRGPRATRWKRQLVSDYRSCVALSFDDFEEVINEINGLIFAQEAICKATRAPVILGWNRQVVDVNQSPPS